ncbi:RNase J family beta-CASP ribonuclease [Candidatus Woesearchaeota archaeon]|nr:MAG: RNase J family beta-CASP ribonuclease [Candidatus Woesearchaeota archaeon]
MIQILTVGGYNEVGKNMTAVRYGDETVIFDMGLHLEKFIEYKGDEEAYKLSSEELMEIGAVPEDSVLQNDNVIAIVPTHAHLDHVGAIPFLAKKYDAPIIATPYTAEIIESLMLNYGKKMKNRIIRMKAGSKYLLSENLVLEFVNMTHSTLNTVTAALHTPEGTVVYANDFKLDNAPSMGKKPDYAAIERIRSEGVKCLIMDSTYSRLKERTPSESVAKKMLQDVLLETDTKGKAVIVTTFSSHIARLKTIVECGRKMGREVVFLGRSLARYVEAARNIGMAKFSEGIEIARFGKQIGRKLKKISRQKDKYLLVVTGHQGEPEATLAKMANGTYEFDFESGDIVVFSCKIIPNTLNRINREKLEEQLERHKVRIFRDVHVSGHGAREDQRELMRLFSPEHIVPSHGNIDMRTGLAELAKEEGYESERIHLSSDGEGIIID